MRYRVIKIMSSTQDKSLFEDTQIVVSMMNNLGIRECDDQVVNHLLEFNNYKSISLILEEAKSCATFANKDTIDGNDIQMAIQMAKDVGLPRSPPSNKLVNARNVSKKINALNSASRLIKPKNESHFSAKNNKLKTRTSDGINKWKKIIEKTAAEILNVAIQTRAMDKIDILSQNVQNLDYLPELTDLDIEEVIANQPNNEEVITPKVNNFNVDSLLNDPYSL